MTLSVLHSMPGARAVVVPGVIGPARVSTIVEVDRSGPFFPISVY
jgi:hypothetical protein